MKCEIEINEHTSTEVVRKLKNDKTPGIDGLLEGHKTFSN